MPQIPPTLEPEGCLSLRRRSLSPWSLISFFSLLGTIALGSWAVSSWMGYDWNSMALPVGQRLADLRSRISSSHSGREIEKADVAYRRLGPGKLDAEVESTGGNDPMGEVALEGASDIGGGQDNSKRRIVRDIAPANKPRATSTVTDERIASLTAGSGTLQAGRGFPGESIPESSGPVGGIRPVEASVADATRWTQDGASLHPSSANSVEKVFSGKVGSGDNVLRDSNSPISNTRPILPLREIGSVGGSANSAVSIVAVAPTNPGPTLGLPPVALAPVGTGLGVPLAAVGGGLVTAGGPSLAGGGATSSNAIPLPRLSPDPNTAGNIVNHSTPASAIPMLAPRPESVVVATSGQNPGLPNLGTNSASPIARTPSEAVSPGVSGLGSPSPLSYEGQSDNPGATSSGQNPLLPIQCIRWVVQPGQTLESLASSLGVSPDYLSAINSGVPFAPGQSVRLPADSIVDCCQ